MPVINKNHNHDAHKADKKGRPETSPEKGSVNAKHQYEALTPKLNKNHNNEARSTPQHKHDKKAKGEASSERGSVNAKGPHREEQERSVPQKPSAEKAGNRKVSVHRKGKEREEPEKSGHDEKAFKQKAVQKKRSRDQEKIAQEPSNGERDVSMTRQIHKKAPPTPQPPTPITPTKVEQKLKYFQQAVKRFVSIPVPEDKVRQLTNTVQRKTRAIPEDIIKSSRQGEDVYVTKDIRHVIRENMKEEKHDAVVCAAQSPKDKIFINGKPFWYYPSRAPHDEDLKGVEDCLEFNANTVLAVGEKKIPLKTMPTMPVILDPMGEIEAMKQKDTTYFNKDIVFSNTFRSMIWSAQPPTSSNLDELSRSPSTVSFSKSNVVDNVTAIIVERSVAIDDPAVTIFYKRKNPENRRVEKFVHRETKKKKRKKKPP